MVHMQSIWVNLGSVWGPYTHTSEATSQRAGSDASEGSSSVGDTFEDIEHHHMHSDDATVLLPLQKVQLLHIDA